MKINLQLSPERLPTLLSLFYLLMLLAAATQFSFLIRFENADLANWLWPVSWLGFFSISVIKTLGFGFYLVCLISLFLSVLKPHLSFIKVISFVSFFILMAIKFSFGKIDHHLHSFLFVSFFMIFVRPSPNQEDKNTLFFQAAQISFVGLYFLTGIWKLRYFLDSCFRNGWSETNPLSTQLAWNSIQAFSPANSGWWRSLPEDVSRLIWLGIIVFEILCIGLVWRPKLQRAGGIAIAVFHVLVFLIMKINFLWAAGLALILLAYNPYKIPENNYNGSWPEK
ncbi:MAG: hypothetical protein AB7O96_01460 [Pseudobdellovibrionaceae bacterium]